MKRVLQKRKNAGETGDCLSACIASLLGLDLDLVPDFGLEERDDKWWISVQKWLEQYNFQLLRWELTSRTPWYAMPGNPMCILVGSTDAGIKHAVVGYPKDPGLGQDVTFEQVHDPADSNGIASVDALMFLIPVDPAQIAKMRMSLNAISVLAGQRISRSTIIEIKTIAREAITGRIASLHFDETQKQEKQQGSGGNGQR